MPPETRRTGVGPGSRPQTQPQRGLRSPGGGDEGGGPPGGEEPDRLAWKGAAAVALVVAGLVVWRTCNRPDDPAAAGGPAANATASAGAASAPGAQATRCQVVGKEPFVIGADRKRPPPSEPREPGQPGGPEPEPEEEQFAPFAVEVGRGAAFDGGFAVGALRDGDNGAVAMVATVGRDGSGGKLVKLARSRGDMAPPRVTGSGGAILAAMLEPNAGGRAIRLAKVEGEQVTWGPELAEGRDESLALDLAAAGERAVVVWDDMTRDGKRSRIMMASLDTATLRSVTSPRPIPDWLEMTPILTPARRKAAIAAGASSTTRTWLGSPL